jgi:hypothetical protein
LRNPGLSAAEIAAKMNRVYNSRELIATIARPTISRAKSTIVYANGS